MRKPLSLMSFKMMFFYYLLTSSSHFLKHSVPYFYMSSSSMHFSTNSYLNSTYSTKFISLKSPITSMALHSMDIFNPYFI